MSGHDVLNNNLVLMSPVCINLLYSVLKIVFESVQQKHLDLLQYLTSKLWILSGKKSDKPALYPFMAYEI